MIFLSPIVQYLVVVIYVYSTYCVQPPFFYLSQTLTIRIDKKNLTDQELFHTIKFGLDPGSKFKRNIWCLNRKTT